MGWRWLVDLNLSKIPIFDVLSYLWHFNRNIGITIKNGRRFSRFFNGFILFTILWYTLWLDVLTALAYGKCLLFIYSFSSFPFFYLPPIAPKLVFFYLYFNSLLLLLYLVALRVRITGVRIVPVASRCCSCHPPSLLL